MLRIIIAIYKTSFLISFAITLIGIVALGFVALMNGMTPQDRWFSLSFLIGGSLSVVVLAGCLALQIENNELLRTIAENTAKPARPSGRSSSASEASLEPRIKRSMPTDTMTVND
jgi:hypothetical protein